MAKKQKPYHGPKTIDLLEQSISIIQSNPLPLLGTYYIGTLPYLLGVIYFLLDMTKSAFAFSYCTEASLGIALLYGWMKWWHRRFCALAIGTISDNRLHTKEQELKITNYLFGLLVHSIGLFIIPVSAVIVVALPYTFAFFQYGSIVQTNSGLRSFQGKCKQHTTQWKIQNISMFVLLTLLWFIVLVNIFYIMNFIPSFIENVLGISTVFSLKGGTMYVVTFFLAALLISWSLADPLVKTAYSLKYYLGNTLNNGQDITTELKQMRAGNREKSAPLVTKTILFALAILCILNPNVTLAETAEVGKESVLIGTMTHPELDASIDEVIQRSVFSWRLPMKFGEERKKFNNPFIEKVFNAIGKFFKAIGRKIKSAFDKVFEWIAKLFPKQKKQAQPGVSFGNWLNVVNVILLVIFGFLLLLCILWIILLIIKKRRKEESVTIQDIAVSADPEDLNTTAEALPADEWLEMAKRCFNEKRYRAAVRALFLSTLATLSQAQIITLDKHKSNRQYLRQVSILGRRIAGLIQEFSKMVLQFELVWYGNRTVTGQIIKELYSLNSRIHTLAKE